MVVTGIRFAALVGGALLLAMVLGATTDGLMVAGGNLTPAEAQLLFSMREYTLTYNEYSGRLPAWLTGPFEHEQVNLCVDCPEGRLVIGVTFEDRRVIHFDAKGYPAPIITVTTDQGTVEEVMASDRPFEEFRRAMRNGAVQVEGNTLLGKMRIGLVLFGLWLMDALGV
jgi:hypothetical protein